MKNLKAILTLILISVMISCQNQPNLKKDKLLNEFFNKNEILELESMVSFVDKLVLERTKETDINKAYHLFFEDMSRKMSDSSFHIVAFPENVRYEFLENMDTIVFHEIWDMSTHLQYAGYKGTIYRDLENFKQLSLNPTGRYVEYMKALGETDDFFESLHNRIVVAGDLPVGIMAWFRANHNKFDFNVPKNRLWASIYILRLEEPFGMKLERYLNK